MARFERFLIAAAFVGLVQACQPASKSDSQAGPVVEETETTNAETATTSATATATTSDTTTDTTTTTASATETGVEPLNLAVSGIVKFSSSADEADGFVHDALIEGATVFLKGFPEQSVVTGATGAFTIAIDLNANAGLTGTSDDYEVIAWKTVNAHKYGRLTQATGVLPNVAFDVGDMVLAYTNLVKFTVKDGNGAPIDPRICSVQKLVGFEGKSNFTYDGNLLKVDYLPQGTYTLHLECTGFQPYTGDFTMAFTETSVPTWHPEDVNLTP